MTKEHKGITEAELVEILLDDSTNKMIWNAAIEAAANAMIGKFDKHGWNYHLPSVGREVEAEIRKLKK